MDPRRDEMLALMQQLEAELRLQRLWSDVAPDAEALASVMPFMYDTLELQQWLQWVFMPRTRALIEAGGRLPGNCNIHPLAEHELTRHHDLDSYRLLELILRIDELMNRA